MTGRSFIKYVWYEY